LNTKEIISNLFFALTLAILYVSTIFVAPVISYGNEVLSLIYIEFIAILYGISLISRNKKIWLIRWGLSIPFSYLVIQYFWNVNYAIRALNWAFPYYGEASAGGNFASSCWMLLLSISCLFSGIIGLFIKIDNFAKFEKIQIIIILIVIGLIVAAVLLLEHQFPPYDYIISHL